jgi:hypothetical protein
VLNIARAVAAGASVTMPAQDMFWGDRFGTIRGPFGHDWQFATHKEDVSPKARQRRFQAMQAQATTSEMRGEACSRIA